MSSGPGRDIPSSDDARKPGGGRHAVTRLLRSAFVWQLISLVIVALAVRY